MKKILNFFNIIKPIFKEFFFSFTISHSSYLNKYDFNKIKKLSNYSYEKGKNIINEYEKLFSSKIGSGSFVSFSSGRISLYVILQCFNVKKNHEVIIQSSNCSAVAFAVMMTGAKPIYVDIDPIDFGPSIDDVKKKINSKTKAIVVQHSFGIPSSSIFNIKELCKNNNIVLIEDCALTYDSKINGISVGTIGDASFFSTDNSKPINTIIGGGLYSESSNVIERALEIRDLADEFDEFDLKKIYKRFLIETAFLTPRKYRFFKINLYFKAVLNKFFGFDTALYQFSTDLHLLNTTNVKKMPVFLAQIGIYELENWKFKKEIILNNFSKLLLIFEKLNFDIPESYLNNDLEIIPHRFIAFDNSKNQLNNILKDRVNNDLFWFKSPLVACLDPKQYGYVYGSCPNTEKYNKITVNIPLIFNDKYFDKLINNLNFN
ncbi:DegT/DnrJ/EryC1/StrS family aminotransferase [Flavobacteriaceae bacterium]|nr:DegT/DnrJ/EryC1/StrS family aminotransferase [Flavobacteriaceae bacterium]